jgi:CubicO group peptidase (beta-lactamase class C family)
MKKPLTLIAALLGLTLVFGSATAGKRDTDLAAIASELSSMQVVAIKDGKLDYQRVYGYRRMPDQLADAQTLYRIASVSKMVTTLGVMRLVEEGKLSLDADVGQYLGFTLRNPSFPQQAITLRMLMSHTSSLRDSAGYFWPAGTKLKDLSFGWASNAAPGQYFSYCNLGWGLVGTIMEKVSGERFDLLMHRLILAPMGLRGGYYPPAFSPVEVATLATLYRKRTTDTEVWDSKGPWIAQVDERIAPMVQDYEIGSNATPFSPTGGLRIAAADLGKIMLMMINRGQHEGKQILQPQSLDLMFSRQWTNNGANGEGKQLGWGLGNEHFADGVGHRGDAYGMWSVFKVDLAKRSGAIVLVGGTATDPAASTPRLDERILAAMAQD